MTDSKRAILYANLSLGPMVLLVSRFMRILNPTMIYQFHFLNSRYSCTAQTSRILPDWRFTLSCLVFNFNGKKNDDLGKLSRSIWIVAAVFEYEILLGFNALCVATLRLFSNRAITGMIFQTVVFVFLAEVLSASVT